MKKVSLLIAFQFLCILAIAQKTIYFNEGFSTMPPSGWTIDAQSANWSSEVSDIAGGSAPEAMFYYDPTFTGTSHLISPVVNTTGLTSIYLSFNHAFSGVYGNFTLGIATRNSPSGTWNTVWSKVNPTTGVSATDVDQVINNSDVGSATFQICFFFTGYSYNIDNWWIDNVMLYTPYDVDAKLKNITNAIYIGPGNADITGKIKNMGKNNITSLTVNYQIGTGTPQTTTLNSLTLLPGSIYTYTLTPPWAATAGNYVVTAYISDVNGIGADSCKSNDTIHKNIGVGTQTTVCRPVFEEFTSSTCNPCASFNGTTFTPFITANGTEFSLIKYQMNWPGNGDPYYTAEGGTRRTYYRVSGVPDLYVNGYPSGMTSGTMLSELNAEKAKSTFFVISGLNPTYAGTTISVPVSILPYVTGPFKVFVVVVEKTTTGNVATNGETSFKHVMMKMLTGGAGLAVNFVAGTSYTNTFTQNLSTTHVEQMSDLQVVVMVQEYTTKEIYQSAESDISLGIDAISINNTSIYPNPATSVVNIVNAENSTIQLFDIFGKLIITDNVLNNNYSLNVGEFAKGTYILKITNSEGSISKKITVLK